MSKQCEDNLCLNQSNSISTRVFPCLYHCKKMLCIQHLSEHDKYYEKQKQLEYLWNNYSLLFNEENIQNELQKLKIKLNNYQQLNKEINDLLIINNIHYSIENNQKLQIAIQTVQNAIQYENQLKSNDIHQPKIELDINDSEENQSTIDYASLSSSIATNDDSLPSILNINGNSPSIEQETDYFHQINEFDHHEDSTESDAMDDSSISRNENNEISNKNLTASKIRGYCPLIQDGAFGINSHIHGIRLCPIKAPENQRTYRLHQHFRCVHHLTSLASLAIARAVGTGQDPMTTKLFNDHHIILNMDEIRTVNCPITRPFQNYPLLHINNLPCNKIKQIRHLKDHLKHVHKFTNKAANIILKTIKTNSPIHMMEFPQWIDIIEDDKHF